jgi:hypothetical protein
MVDGTLTPGAVGDGAGAIHPPLCRKGNTWHFGAWLFIMPFGAIALACLYAPRCSRPTSSVEEFEGLGACHLRSRLCSEFSSGM